MLHAGTSVYGNREFGILREAQGGLFLLFAALIVMLAAVLYFVEKKHGA